MVDTIVQYCKTNLPRYYHVDPLQDIQVLTPMQRGECGAVNLNQVLQEAMNPSKIFLRRGGTQYRLKDKVMQIRNDYDKEVFNGDIGTITKVDVEERELTVLFDEREVVYDVTELDELALAYAVTIHKSQEANINRCHAIYYESFCHAAEKSPLYRCDQGEKDPGTCRREESCVLCDKK